MGHCKEAAVADSPELFHFFHWICTTIAFVCEIAGAKHINVINVERTYSKTITWYPLFNSVGLESHCGARKCKRVVLTLCAAKLYHIEV